MANRVNVAVLMAQSYNLAEVLAKHDLGLSITIELTPNQYMNILMDEDFAMLEKFNMQNASFEMCGIKYKAKWR